MSTLSLQHHLESVQKNLPSMVIFTLHFFNISTRRHRKWKQWQDFSLYPLILDSWITIKAKRLCEDTRVWATGVTHRLCRQVLHTLPAEQSGQNTGQWEKGIKLPHESGCHSARALVFESFKSSAETIQKVRSGLQREDAKQNESPRRYMCSLLSVLATAEWGGLVRLQGSMVPDWQEVHRLVKNQSKGKSGGTTRLSSEFKLLC